MRYQFILPALLIAASCSASDDVVDLGNLVDGKGDIVEFDIPFRLAPGESTPMFRIFADGPFTIDVFQAGTASLDLMAFVEGFPEPGSTGANPSLSISPSGPSFVQFFVRNLDSSATATGSLSLRARPKEVERTFTVTEYVRGELADTSEGAMEEWETECMFVQSPTLPVAASLIKGDCGSPTEVQQGDKLFVESVAQFEYSIITAENSVVRETSHRLFAAEPADSVFGAYVNFLFNCSGQLDSERALLGGAMIAGSCGVPEFNPLMVGSEEHGFFSGNVTVFMERPLTLTASLSTHVLGDSVEPTDLFGAVSEWAGRCDEWVQAQREFGGSDRIERYSCGDPRLIQDDSGIRFESKPTLELRDGKVEVVGQVSGEPSADFRTALRSLERRCADELAKIVAARDDVVGGSCDPVEAGDENEHHLVAELEIVVPR